MLVTMDIYMKLPQFFSSLFQNKSKKNNVFLSLYLDLYRVSASFWYLDAKGAAVVMASETTDFLNDTWDERSTAVDTIIGLLEEKTGQTDVTKAILGLPSAYLTDAGEIRKEVGLEIRNFTKSLELTAIGFVPLQQAVIFKLKKDEGVPPSVILLGIGDKTLSLGVYKIGELTGVREIEKHDDIVSEVEQGLKSFTDLEVLPTRLMIFGSRSQELEDLKSKLMKHPWTSRVNFLHFPKIEIIEPSLIIESISIAGASEMASTFEDHADEEIDDGTVTATVPVVVDPDPQEEIMESSQPVEDMSAISSDDVNVHTAVADSTPIEVAPDAEAGNVADKVESEVSQAQEVIAEDFSVDQVAVQDANVVMVDAESLGFKKNTDVLEVQADASGEVETDVEEEYDEVSESSPYKTPRLDVVQGITKFFSNISKYSGGSKVAIGLVLLMVIASIIGTMYWYLSGVQLTIYAIPQNIISEQEIVIDPAATTTDAQKFVVPGKLREKSVSGENTMPVNGKKSIGDPAKGTVTIYNKTLSTKVFKKGTALLSGNLQFTLNSEVQIASASESVGSITFGKGDAAVTAVAIGATGNVQSGTEFTFKDISSGTAIARNDKAFAGGNSREVTVVSRADYDSFVKIQSEELVDKAKSELSKSVQNNEKLIDSTIKTTVTEKVFNKELDEEATELQGKLTLSVSGIAYSDSDIHALLINVSSDKIPSGYEVDEGKTTLNLSGIQVKKDGKISATAKMEAIALPKFDTVGIQKSIGGKKLSEAQEYLKKIPGVGGIEFGFTNAWIRSYLPLNTQKISLIFSVLQ